MDATVFENPGSEYRGVTLWMLNDKLEEEEISRQLKGFHEAGWGAAIGRTFNGLLTPYLGDEWMAIIRRIIEQSATQDMRVWLQAGYMPSGMPTLDRAHAHRGLTRRPVDAAGEEDDVVVCEHEGSAYVIRLLPHILDLLNGEAVTDYLDLAYKEPWYSRFGEHFGKTVEAIWVDEPHFRPPLLPWNEHLPDVFRKTWGYDLLDHVPELFVPTGEYQQVRHHYWRLILNMFLEGYFRPVSEWCAEHNIKFAGHLMGEDTLCNQTGFTGACMPCYEYMQLPGIDHLTRSLNWPTGKPFVSTPKQISSAAAQLGKREVLVEIYGVSAQGITFEQRKRIAEWMAVLGINYRCYHGSFYSMRGRRKRIYVPNLSHQQPWWADNRLISDYFARLSYALREGSHIAQVLVLHPGESAFCLYDSDAMARPHDRDSEPRVLQDLDSDFVRVCENLLNIQRDFNLGDETLLAKYGRPEGNKLVVGQQSYSAVVLPRMLTIRRTTLELLEAFAAAGGTILAAGDLPSRLDGVETEETGRLARITRITADDSPSLKTALDGAIPAEVEVLVDNAEYVWIHARETEGGRVFFVLNIDPDEAVSGEVKVRGTGRMEAWDLQTGESAEMPQRVDGDCTVTPLQLPPLGSVLFTLQPDEAPMDIAAADVTVVRSVPLSNLYRVRRDAPNALTLDHCRLRKGEGPWIEDLPLIAHQSALSEEDFSGPITLSFTCTVASVPENLCLVIENADEWQIRVNGQSAEYAGLPYYLDRSFLPVDIAALVQTGENTIELAREFTPVPRPKFALAGLFESLDGVELESIYLVGDFAVCGEVSAGEAKPNCVRWAPQFTIEEETLTTSGDLVRDGYPFYAGRALLTQSVNLQPPADGERMVLKLPGMDAALAKVKINGQEAGAIAWAPYEIDITGVVRGGDNEVEIELVGTLRNLLGPHHREGGDLDHCWSTAFNYTVGWTQFEHAEESEAGWTDDYFSLNFGILGEVSVEYRR